MWGNEVRIETAMDCIRPDLEQSMQQRLLWPQDEWLSQGTDRKNSDDLIGFTDSRGDEESSRGADRYISDFSEVNFQTRQTRMKPS
jgi:hypothetical protein